MRHLCLGICVVSTSMGILASAGMDVENKIEHSKDRIARMAALNDKERMELLGVLSKERSDIQGNLIYQLGNSEAKQMKFSAAFLLGMYRMEQSVHHLSRFIALENEETELAGRLPLWDRYPIVEALIRIGKPAVAEMIRNIQMSEDEKVRELSVRVIRYVEGPEIGRIILEKELAKRSDSPTRARIETAIASFDKLVEKTSAAPNGEGREHKKQ